MPTVEAGIPPASTALPGFGARVIAPTLAPLEPAGGPSSLPRLTRMGARPGGAPRLARLAGPLAPYWSIARRHVAIIAAWTALSLVGTVAAPALVDHPLLLVLLSPRLVFLAAAAPRLDPLVFLAVGLVRLSVTDPVYFSLGRRVGHQAFADLEARGRDRPWVRRAGWLRGRSAGILTAAVLVRPNARHVGLAGAQGMSGRRVAALTIVGTLGYLLAVRWGCDRLLG